METSVTHIPLNELVKDDENESIQRFNFIEKDRPVVDERSIQYEYKLLLTLVSIAMSDKEVTTSVMKKN